MDKYKQPFRKTKQSFLRPLPPLGDQIHYLNTSFLIRFVSEQGKILPRRINKVTLQQQRLITLAIKQARILSLLPFTANETLLKMKKAHDEKVLKRKNKKVLKRKKAYDEKVSKRKIATNEKVSKRKKAQSTTKATGLIIKK